MSKIPPCRKIKDACGTKKNATKRNPGNRLIHSTPPPAEKTTLSARHARHTARIEPKPLTTVSGWPSFVGLVSVCANGAGGKRYEREIKTTNVTIPGTYLKLLSSRIVYYQVFQVYTWYLVGPGYEVPGYGLLRQKKNVMRAHTV